MCFFKNFLRSTFVLVLAITISKTANCQSGVEHDNRSPLTFVERSDDELLILEMRIGKYVLSEGITGYAHRGGVLLSLDEVTMALEFAITTDPAGGQASGWFINESRLFSFDYARKEVIIDGQKNSFNAELVELHQDGIFVDAALLGKWFSIDVTVSLSRQLISIASRQPLPIEQSLKREESRGKQDSRSYFKPSYQRKNSPYSFVDWPFVDANLNLLYRNQKSGGRESRYSALAGGDLAFMSSTLFMAGIDGDSLTDIRLSMGRDDPDGNLFGPLHAQSYSLGDIFSPQIPLIAGSNAGRGVEISTFPISRASEFDRTTLQGELPLNWEVELYRNEVLLDNQPSREDGRYEFIDVPLLYGNNILRLVFYGPQGQKREEVRNIFVGSSLVQPGSGNFRISATQEDRSVFLNKNYLLNRKSSGEGRYIAEYELGISNRLSISANGVSVPVDSVRKNYASTGLRAAVLGAFSRIDYSKQHGGGSAVQFSTQFNFLGNDIYAEHGQFFDFESERIRKENDPVERQTRIRLNGKIPFKPLSRIPFSLDGFLEHRESGRERAELSNRLSIYWHGLSASNTLKGSLFRGGGIVTTKRVDGQLLVSGRLKKLYLRSQLNYDPPPHHRFINASFTGDYSILNDFSTRFSVNRDLIAGRWTDFSLGLNRTFESFIIGLEGKYQNNDNYSISMNISFSVGKQPRTDKFMLRSRRMAYNGAASVRAFLDENQNNIYDVGDKPLEGVRFRQSGVLSKETDERGITFIPDLFSYRQADISVDLGSLGDPYWMPTSEGFGIMPRPGKTVLLNFPIISTGEIDGTVYLKRGKILKGASNVSLELLDIYRAVVQQTKTAFDGFYLFTNVPPGRYFVRISQDQAKRLSLIQSTNNKVDILQNGDVESGIDITIEKFKEIDHD